MFESKRERVAPWSVFVVRMLYSLAMSLAVIALSLGIGTWGYHVFGGLEWIDALLNAAMILTGMGPVNPMLTTGGKLFAVFYCLFSGIVFLSLMAIILAPVYHRFLHTFHLEVDEETAGG